MIAAVTFKDGLPRPTRDHLAAVVDRAMRLRFDAEPVRRVDRPDLVVFSTAEGPACDVLPLTVTPASDAMAGRRPPPWAEARLRPDGIEVETDAIGLKHVYVVRAEQWAAVSTSALVLGSLTGGELDDVAWGAMAFMGHAIGRRTIFRGVERLPGRATARLTRGHLEVTRAPEPSVPAPDTGAEAIRIAVNDCLAAAPDAGIELSGGLDSRVILAALPSAHRRRLRALTLGREGDDDVVVARTIARRLRLDHDVVAVDATETSQVALKRVRQSVLAHDGQADGLAEAVLDDVEARAPAGARFTGVNGEYCRGFYYPGLFPGTRVSASSVRRLSRWRIFANHRADSTLFAAGWLREVEDQLLASITGDMHEYGSSLRAASDEYYVHQRLPNWAGPGYSHAAERRLVLAPFLHPAFLAWVNSVPTSERAGSRAMSRTLFELDPWLASLPLAGGLKPVDLGSSGVPATYRRGRLWVKKVNAKVNQRIQREGRPAAGTQGLAPAVASAWRNESAHESLSGVGFLGDRFVERCASPLDAASLSFLLNLETAVGFVRQVSRS